MGRKTGKHGHWEMALWATGLAVALTACGGGEARTSGEYLCNRFREAAGCETEAVVSCTYEDGPWEASLRCVYDPEGGSTVEVLAPEEIAGIRAVLDGENRYLVYDGEVLNAGPVSREGISPAECLPRLLDALREGWLLEESEEEVDGAACVRLCLDQRGETTEKVYATLWLRQADGVPVRGEITVDGNTVLYAAFTNFQICDTMEEVQERAG